jgi:hypothetical protein
MGNKALIFDISTKRMKEDGMTDSDVSKIYAVIAKELRQAGLMIASNNRCIGLPMAMASTP